MHILINVINIAMTYFWTFLFPVTICWVSYLLLDGTY